jgi:hypothetical protein
MRMVRGMAVASESQWVTDSSGHLVSRLTSGTYADHLPDPYEKPLFNTSSARNMPTFPIRASVVTVSTGSSIVSSNSRVRTRCRLWPSDPLRDS